MAVIMFICLNHGCYPRHDLKCLDSLGVNTALDPHHVFKLDVANPSTSCRVLSPDTSTPE